MKGTPLPDIPQTRLIELGTAPTAQLGMIRDDLERGYYKKVETGLNGLPRATLKREPVRRYVAGLWNNLGVQQEKFGGIELSVKAFRKAAGFDSTSPIAHLNLTQAYWGLRDPAMTPEFLHQVIQLAPTDPFPHLALAELLLDNGNVSGATKHLKEAGSQGRIDSRLQTYARRLAAKLDQAPRRKEAPVVLAKHAPAPTPPRTLPSPPASETNRSAKSVTPQPTAPVHAENTPAPSLPTSTPTPTPPQEKPASQPGKHFVVAFQGKQDPDTWARIQAILEYAYQDICQKFGHEPSSPITVVLHTTIPFDGNMDNPVWTDAQFDRTTGSIHVPTQGALDDLGLLSRLLRHEFVHAMIHHKMGPRHENVPAWLVEGLAVHLADDPWPHLEEARSKDFAVVPLITRPTEWNRLSPESAPVAYLEAQAATQHLIERYSMYEVRQLMNLVRNGQSLEAALQQKLSVSPEQFQRQWADNLQTNLKANRS